MTNKVVNGSNTVYRYDAIGNLLGVTLPTGRTNEYLVDGRNCRVGKKVNGVFTNGFLYADSLALVAELDSQTNVISVFVYGSRPNVPDYMVRGGITYRIISDHLGSPRLVVQAETGEVAQRMDYDEFGRVVLDTNPGFQPFGFAGGLYDPDTGLVRLGARDYDAETGRWQAKDPLLFHGAQLNLYLYAAGDPVNLTDPTGCGPNALYRWEERANQHRDRYDNFDWAGYDRANKEYEQLKAIYDRLPPRPESTPHTAAEARALYQWLQQYEAIDQQYGRAASQRDIYQRNLFDRIYNDGAPASGVSLTGLEG